MLADIGSPINPTYSQIAGPDGWDQNGNLMIIQASSSRKFRQGKLVICQVFSFRVRKSGSAHGGLYEAEQFVRAKRFDHHRHRPEPLSGYGYLNINRSGDQNGR